MRTGILLVVILYTFTGCQTGPYSVASSSYDIPSGSHLILKKALTIPANTSRIYIQASKVITPSQKDSYHPHCWFLSWKLLDSPQSIEPDTFIITHSAKFEEDYAQTPKLYASLTKPGLMKVLDGSVTMLEYKTKLTISSEKQPNIRQLICNRWETEPTDARHLTVKEIRDTLGDVVELQLKEPA